MGLLEASLPHVTHYNESWLALFNKSYPSIPELLEVTTWASSIDCSSCDIIVKRGTLTR